jgi:hypothetical protein
MNTKRIIRNDLLHVTLDRNQWQDLVNMVISLQVSQKGGISKLDECSLASESLSYMYYLKLAEGSGTSPDK